MVRDLSFRLFIDCPTTLSVFERDRSAITLKALSWDGKTWSNLATGSTNGSH